MRTPVFMILLLWTLPLQAQRSPSEIAATMGRGINLGNTLEPPNEDSWNNGPAREEFFDWYVEAGFQTVRIPVRWDNHTAAEPPYAVSDVWMDRVEEVVDWGLDRGLVVILNTHHDDWIKQQYAVAGMRDRFDAIWRQISERFATKTDRLLFEIINEPFGLTRQNVDELNERVLGIIRQTNPTRVVIFSGNEWAGLDQLVTAAIPDDPYLMGYFHSYDPWPFAGEGTGTWETSEFSGLQQRMERAADWSASTGIPVMISEFGAVHSADRASRLRFYAAYTEEAMRHGIPFQVWDDGGMFGLLNRSSGTWDEATDLLLHAWPDGPNGLTASIASDTTAVLSWANRGAYKSLIVERSVGSSGVFDEVGRLFGNEVRFVDTGLAFGTEYWYRLRAIDLADRPKLLAPAQAVTPARSRAPFLGAAHPIPGVIEAEHFDFGGEGIAFSEVDAVNVPAAFRASEAVDIAAVAGGGYEVVDFRIGEWMKYTVDVIEAGGYTVRILATSEGTGGRLFVRFASGESAMMPVSATSPSWLEASMALPVGPNELELRSTGTRALHVDRMEVKLASATRVEAFRLTEFDVYPNPAHDHLTVEYPGLTPVPYRIIDVVGRTVENGIITNMKTHLAISQLASGWYFLLLNAQDRFVYEAQFLRQ